MVDYSWDVAADAWLDRRRPMLLGCGGLLAGLLLGVLLTVFCLAAFGPHPGAAAPISNNPNGNVAISMDDIYLTSIVESSVGSASLPITLRNIQVEIQPDNQVTISAHVDSPLPGADQLAASGRLRVQSGLLAMRITDAQIGGLPMPGVVTSALEKAINEQLAQVTHTLVPPNFAITSVTTTEHHLQMRISKQG